MALYGFVWVVARVLCDLLSTPVDVVYFEDHKPTLCRVILPCCPGHLFEAGLLLNR